MSLRLHSRRWCGRLPGGKEAGVSLLESLIALVVLSVGLLALGLMQAKTLRFSNSAYQRTKATWLAYDILERMRANATSANSGRYNTTFGLTHGGASDCVANACTPAQMAEFDLSQWKGDLGGYLPAGDGEVTRTTAPGTGTVYTISIRWDDDRRNDVVRYQVFTTRSEL